MTVLSRSASPSDLEAAGALNNARKRVYRWFLQDGNQAVLVLARQYIETKGRVTAARLFRATPGAGDSTVVDIHASVGGAGGATILSAAKLTITQASGANQKVEGVLDTAFTGYEDVSIPMNRGDWLEAHLDADEGAAAAGLSIEVEFLAD